MLTLGYGEYTMKKSSAFEWHRRFKEGRENVQDGLEKWGAKNVNADANVDRVRILVRSDLRLSVRRVWYLFQG
jgi:hypothetical protein